MEMEPQIFDFVKFEKEKAIATFNRIAKLRQFFEVLLVLGAISWSSARAPPLLRAAAAYAVDLSAYLLNHHIVFLIGNAIIFSLFLLCRRQSDAASTPPGDDLYDEYVKHSDAAAEADRREPADPPPPSSPTKGGAEVIDEEEKQIVVCAEANPNPQCDDMAAAIDNARRQIKRFERTQSEKLKREIRATLRRSETQTRRNSVSCGGERFDAAEIERLSSEEFRRTIDAFIDENWSTKKTANSRFDEYQKYQLLQMA
ncbi:uncharacterized protein LOC131009779 [Salvia miltiorrhiza]|uniref:uncharacterized protein LOC131009779 n=1 Tax=Salvia miltiorrhiza TaxID=226208 RepID=UPI0025AD9242|nr:uncharacterized protein LOC131009779 [Salvia miltiorrhiza]